MRLPATGICGDLYQPSDSTAKHPGGLSSTMCYVSVTSTSGTTASGQGVELGGTLQANAMAAADGHAKVLTFLRGI